MQTIFKLTAAAPIYIQNLISPTSQFRCATVVSKFYKTRHYANEASEKDELQENEKKLTIELETSRKEIQSLNNKISELEDKYKRALADGENMRRRLTKQIEDAKLFGIQGFCKDLLEVADILGHATEAVPKEEEVENAEPNTIVVVSKIGYKLHERCIRPALVGVAKG
ncbi:grpE protein homolog, mitochondrial isoform X2 [Wyeomyia smithii]|uniref:grpE protein homolog, mitochondrial isoform X2 n=1 Tax=Wyeomyia smithii TaxID=174621 RepID=UPI0024680ECD|nr:grpE protein homolog, mitochondrial isoform X2 [Wyeomyia smithii]